MVATPDDRPAARLTKLPAQPFPSLGLSSRHAEEAYWYEQSMRQVTTITELAVSEVSHLNRYAMCQVFTALRDMAALQELLPELSEEANTELAMMTTNLLSTVRGLTASTQRKFLDAVKDLPTPSAKRSFFEGLMDWLS